MSIIEIADVEIDRTIKFRCTKCYPFIVVEAILFDLEYLFIYIFVFCLIYFPHAKSHLVFGFGITHLSQQFDVQEYIVTLTEFKLESEDALGFYFLSLFLKSNLKPILCWGVLMRQKWEIAISMNKRLFLQLFIAIDWVIFNVKGVRLRNCVVLGNII
jgi:hypothetical protein